MSQTDEQLMIRVAGGDSAAFAELYDRHSPRVYGLLVRLLRHRGGAEDVLQETFWQAWSQAGRYDAARSTPLVWILLIARSKAIDLLRRPRRETPAESAREPSTGSDIPDSLESKELSATIQAGLDQLPEEQRSALVLAFFECLTHEEIAARQAIPLGTAKTRIRLGMRRLRDHLSRYQEYAA